MAALWTAEFQYQTNLTEYNERQVLETDIKILTRPKRFSNCNKTDWPDCAQRAQTSAKASNLNQKWSGIRIRISGLIQIQIWMSAGSLPKCCEMWSHYLVDVSHFAECRENRPVIVWEMLINLLRAVARISVWGVALPLPLPPPPLPSISFPSPPPSRRGPPLYQLWGLGERCKLPQHPGRQRIFEHFGGSKTYLVAAISHLCYAVQLTKFTQISLL